MSGNPLILREKRSTARSSTFSVDASFFLLFRPVSGSCGSKMGAGRARCVRHEPAPAVRFPSMAVTDFSTLPRDAHLLSAMSAQLVVPLQQQHDGLDPFALARAIEQQLERIYALANSHHSGPAASALSAPVLRPVRKRLSIKPSPHFTSPRRSVTSETARWFSLRSHS